MQYYNFVNIKPSGDGRTWCRAWHYIVLLREGEINTFSKLRRLQDLIQYLTPEQRKLIRDRCIAEGFSPAYMDLLGCGVQGWTPPPRPGVPV
jgi:hypothetical protein